MLIVGLNGSPNKNGNTRFLLDKLFDDLTLQNIEYHILDVPDLIETAHWQYCKGCYPCDGKCYTGTKLEDAFNLLSKADALILGSPVYFGTVSAQLKSFFDKTRKQRGEKAFYNKIAAGVTSGASKYGGQETTMRALHDMMLVHGMIIVGDGFIDDDCGHHGVSAQKPSNTDEFAIKRANIMGKRIIEVCKTTQVLRKNN